jgi:hypothetical protein
MDRIKKAIPIAGKHLACHHQGVGLKTGLGFEGPQPLAGEGVDGVQFVVKAPHVGDAILNGGRMA